LYAALDEKYIAKDVFDRLYNKGRELEKSINAFARHLQKRKD